MRNNFELALSEQLYRAGCDFNYEKERIPYILSGYYIPDFIINTKSGKIYIEAKGYLRPEHKRKMKAVKKQHPELDLRMVFCADRSKQAKNQIKWAIRNGFKYAVRRIPVDWLNE